MIAPKRSSAVWGVLGVFIIIKMRYKKSMSWAARGREAPAYLQDVGVVSPPRVRSTGVSTTVTFGHLTGREGRGPAQQAPSHRWVLFAREYTHEVLGYTHQVCTGFVEEESHRRYVSEMARRLNELRDSPVHPESTAFTRPQGLCY